MLSFNELYLLMRVTQCEMQHAFAEAVGFATARNNKARFPGLFRGDNDQS